MSAWMLNADHGLATLPGGDVSTYTTVSSMSTVQYSTIVVPITTTIIQPAGPGTLTTATLTSKHPLSACGESGLD